MSAAENRLNPLYFDEEIDSVLARIDAALPNCYQDHLDDTEALAKLSRQAVATLRMFREEVLAKTKEALGEGDIELLEPGDRSKVLLEALGRVLEYAEARSCLAVEAMRWDQMMKFGTGSPGTPTTQRRAGKPLTYRRLSEELTVAVRLNVERVVVAAEVRLQAASKYYGPRDVQKWGAVALWVLNAINRVDESMKLGHQSMRSFEDRLEGKNRLIKMEAAITEGNREGNRQREEIGAGIKMVLDRVGVLKQQIDEVLTELNAVRIDQANGKCPRGFFLVPADKSAWSWTKKADCFSLYTRNVQLFFVCRMFFEELKAAAAKSEAGREGLTARHANVQFEHEFSEPIPLELPKRVVAERLHAIRLSVKIMKILVDAASLGLSLGSVIPNLSFLEQDALLNAVQSHLALAEDQAAGGTPAEDLNFQKSSSGRLKFFLKILRRRSRPENTGSLVEAHQALQGYLDKEHPGVWQEKVQAKLKALANPNRTDFAYICEKTEKHMLHWTGNPEPALP